MQDGLPQLVLYCCNALSLCGCSAVCLIFYLFICVLFCATGELSQRGSKHKEEVAALQKSISALDREKDALQDEVDQKTEKLVVLQDELSKKVATRQQV